MCHDTDSRPPAPPSTGEVAERGLLTLTSADGTEFDAAFATPAADARAGVVVLPDVRGLHPYYVALAERFAEAGFPSVAVDYYARTAGRAGHGTRDQDFDWKTHMSQATAEGIDGDTAAAIAYLRERTRADLPVITVGFCFGGSNAWRQAEGALPLAATVGFYGRPQMVGDSAGSARLPVLMLIAGDDMATPVADQLALAETMRSAGADVETAVYDGAPHSFFDRSADQWAEASADAWRRILALLDRVTAGPAQAPAR
jgi:carboxymethylenebutenolidase